VLAGAIGPALAQGGGAIDPGVYTQEVIHPWAPFRTPNINQETFDLATLGNTANGWSPAELLEMRQRCSAIVADPTRTGIVLMTGVPYSEKTVAFCNALFEWVAANRPDAPDTDAELAAQPAPAAP
jgi:hypothetical protein